jgi:hypothetical protein
MLLILTDFDPENCAGVDRVLLGPLRLKTLTAKAAKKSGRKGAKHIETESAENGATQNYLDAKKSGLAAVTLNLRFQPRLPGSVVGEASMRRDRESDKIT